MYRVIIKLWFVDLDNKKKKKMKQKLEAADVILEKDNTPYAGREMKVLSEKLWSIGS